MWCRPEVAVAPTHLSYEDSRLSMPSTSVMLTSSCGDGKRWGGQPSASDTLPTIHPRHQQQHLWLATVRMP